MRALFPLLWPALPPSRPLLCLRSFGGSRGSPRACVSGPSSHLPSQGPAPSLDDCSVPPLSPASLDRRRLSIWSTATGPCSGGGSAAANGQVACEKCKLSARFVTSLAEEPTWLWEAQKTASARHAENTQIRSEPLVGAETRGRLRSNS